MTSLEQIVLPLEQSRQLMEHGVVLDTVAWWQQSLAHIDYPASAHIKGDNSALGIEDFFEDICPAPTLSELLDAIRARQPYAVVQCGNRRRDCVGSERNACSAMQPEGCSDIRYGDTDLLAAASLLLEAAK